MRIDPRDAAPASGELVGRRPDAAPRPERRGVLPGSDDGDRTAGAEPARPLQGGAADPAFPLQELSIRREDEIGKVVVQVIDSETGEVVRQIPSEEWVRVLKRLERAKGVLVDEAG